MSSSQNMRAQCLFFFLCRFNVSDRMYNEFLRPTLLVGLFAEPESLSAAAVLNTLYFYGQFLFHTCVILHQKWIFWITPTWEIGGFGSCKSWTFVWSSWTPFLGWFDNFGLQCSIRIWGVIQNIILRWYQEKEVLPVCFFSLWIWCLCKD